MSQIFPTGEPTSAQNYSTMLANVAYKLGVASYGSSGQAAPQPPTDPFNLSICANIVNDALRMLITDGPSPNGWYWQNQIAQIDLWPEIGPDPTGSTYVSSTSYDSTNNLTTLQLTTPASPPPVITSTQYPALWVPNFAQSMELRNIWLNGQPSTGTPGWFVPSSSPLSSTSTIGFPYTVVNYLSPFTIQVSGDIRVGPGSTTFASTHNKIPFAFACTGDYTLPANFGGTYTSEITWISNTNRGVVVDWVDEAAIRQQRQVYAQQFGTPYWFAVRPIPLPTVAQMSINPPRPRWELMSFRITSEFLSCNFAYFLSFNNLVNMTDEAPVPLAFDEAVLAAIRAQAERYQLDSLNGPDWAYYRTYALPNATKLNMMSAPKKLGYCGNPTRNYGPSGLLDWRRNWYLRPNVAPPGSM